MWGAFALFFWTIFSYTFVIEGIWADALGDYYGYHPRDWRLSDPIEYWALGSWITTWFVGIAAWHLGKRVRRHAWNTKT